MRLEPTQSSLMTRNWCWWLHRLAQAKELRSGGITAGGSKLIEDARFVRTTGALIAAVNVGQILAFGGQTHVRCFGNHELESTYRRTLRPPPRPGNIYPESTRWLGLDAHGWRRKTRDPPNPPCSGGSASVMRHRPSGWVRLFLPPPSAAVSLRQREPSGERVGEARRRRTRPSREG